MTSFPRASGCSTTIRNWAPPRSAVRPASTAWPPGRPRRWATMSRATSSGTPSAGSTIWPPAPMSTPSVWARSAARAAARSRRSSRPWMSGSRRPPRPATSPTSTTCCRPLAPQDGEQSIPGFLAAGLDIADLVEMAAPRPYAVVSTTEDMFPFAGAKRRSRRQGRLQALRRGGPAELDLRSGRPWGAGPDLVGHRRLLHPLAEERARQAPVPRAAAPGARRLLVTPTGQISTSIGGETIQSLNAARLRQVSAASRRRLASPIWPLLRRQAEDRHPRGDLRAVQPGGAPPEGGRGRERRSASEGRRRSGRRRDPDHARRRRPQARRAAADQPAPGDCGPRPRVWPRPAMWC
jgi:hypothetical protein